MEAVSESSSLEDSDYSNQLAEPATYRTSDQERPKVHYLVKVSREAKVYYGFSRSVLRRLTQFFTKILQTIFLARKQVNLQQGYLENLDCSCRTVRDHPAPPVSESTVGWIFPTYPTNNSLMAKRRSTISTPARGLEVVARRFAFLDSTI